MERALTHKIFLASSHFQANESHNARSNGKGSQRESKRNPSGRPQNTLGQEDYRNRVNNQVASQVEREVQDERFRRVENGTRALFLRLLHGNRRAAKEGIVEEDREVAGDDEGGHSPQHLAHCWSSIEIEVSPVEG